MTTPQIIFEDKDLVVVNKPSGWLVHPDDHTDSPTLTDWLLTSRPEIIKVGDDPQRPGIMHRLDKEASGLIVIAKTNPVFDDLKQQFKSHKIKKVYHVLVLGSVDRDEGTIDFAITRSHRTGRMAAVPANPETKAARTNFFVLNKNKNFTLLEVQTETGRTHQIRTHFFAYNHPVAGDPLYHSKKLKDDCPRLFLHAATLGFNHPTSHEWVEFNCPLPEELTDYLKQKKIGLTAN